VSEYDARVRKAVPLRGWSSTSGIRIFGRLFIQRSAARYRLYLRPCATLVVHEKKTLVCSPKCDISSFVTPRKTTLVNRSKKTPWRKDLACLSVRKTISRAPQIRCSVGSDTAIDLPITRFHSFLEISHTELSGQTPSTRQGKPQLTPSPRRL
jgi:hypothetical protein